MMRNHFKICFGFLTLLTWTTCSWAGEYSTEMASTVIVFLFALSLPVDLVVVASLTLFFNQF